MSDEEGKQKVREALAAFGARRGVLLYVLPTGIHYAGNLTPATAHHLPALLRALARTIEQDPTLETRPVAKPETH